VLISPTTASDRDSDSGPSGPSQSQATPHQDSTMSTMFYPYTIRFYLILGINVDELMQWDYPPLDEDGTDLGHVHGKYILVCIVYYMLTFVLVV